MEQKPAYRLGAGASLVDDSQDGKSELDHSSFVHMYYTCLACSDTGGSNHAGADWPKAIICHHGKCRLRHCNLQ